VINIEEYKKIIIGPLGFLFISGGTFLSYLICKNLNLIDSNYILYLGIVQIVIGGSLFAAPTYLQLIRSKSKSENYFIPLEFFVVHLFFAIVYSTLVLILNDIEYIKSLYILPYIVSTCVLTNYIYLTIFYTNINKTLYIGIIIFFIESLIPVITLLLNKEIEFIYLYMGIAKIIPILCLKFDVQICYRKLYELLKFGLFLSINSFIVSYIVLHDRLITKFLNTFDEKLYLNNYHYIIFANALVTALNLFWNPNAFKCLSQKKSLFRLYKKYSFFMISPILIISLIVWLANCKSDEFSGFWGIIYFSSTFLLIHIRHIAQSVIIHSNKMYLLIFCSLFSLLCLFIVKSLFNTFILLYILPLLVVTLLTVSLTFKILTSDSRYIK